MPVSLSSRSLLFKTFAALLLGAMPGAAFAAAITSSVVLTITSPGAIYFGQSVDGYANVTTSDGNTPTGTISFYDGAQSICTIPVSQSATCPASTGTGFAVGDHMLTAVYSGDSVYAGSTSNAVPVSVLQDSTSVGLGSSADPTVSGQTVTFTATIAGRYSMPSGLISFLDGTSVLGTAPLDSWGVATLSTASLGPGSHTLTASYAGDTNSLPSVSPPLAQTVNPSVIQSQGSFSLAVAGPTNVGVGRTADLTVTVVPGQGFTAPVELSCAGLPMESACTFGQHTIPAGGGTTTLEISTIAPHDCGSSAPYFLGAGFPLALFFLPLGKRRTLKGLLVALVAICGVSTLTGCGSCTDLGTRPGTYTIRVIGTPTGAQSSSGVVAKVTLKVVL